MYSRPSRSKAFLRQVHPVDESPVVRLNGVGYAAAGKELLDNIDLSFRPGLKTVVMGPNGAGKSVMLRLVQGLIEPQKGSVEWAPQLPEPRSALVFQRPTLLRRTVAANLDHALKVYGVNRSDRPARIEDLLDLAGLSGLRHQPARRLSGGEQQRLAVVRAMASKPQLLLLDEPTASLDPAATAAIEALVKSADRDGTKIVFVTHDAGQASRIGDEIVFLHRGRIVEQSPADQFFGRPDSEEARAFLQGRLLIR